MLFRIGALGIRSPYIDNIILKIMRNHIDASKSMIISSHHWVLPVLHFIHGNANSVAFINAIIIRNGNHTVKVLMLFVVFVWLSNSRCPCTTYRPYFPSFLCGFGQRNSSTMLRFPFQSKNHKCVRLLFLFCCWWHFYVKFLKVYCFTVPEPGDLDIQTKYANSVVIYQNKWNGLKLALWNTGSRVFGTNYSLLQ